MAIEPDPSGQLATTARLGHSGATDPGPALAEEAKERLREIVEGFLFRRLRGEDGKHIRRLLVKSPPGLGKTREAIGWRERETASCDKDWACGEPGGINQ
jgi:hypothetical protein